MGYEPISDRVLVVRLKAKPRNITLIQVYGPTMHKAREHQQPLYMCFVDFKKAFDSISHDKLWVTMMDMGYPIHMIDLLAKLYKKQLAKVKVAGPLSEWFRVKKGSDKVVSSLRTCSTS